MSQTIDNKAILASLEAQRVDLQARLQQIEAAIASIRPLVLGPNAAPASGSYGGMSIAQAAKKCLEVTKRPLTNAELVSALKAGGMRSDSQNITTTVAGALSRHTEVFVRIANTWALREWDSSAERRSREDQASGRGQRRRRTRTRNRRVASSPSVARPALDLGVTAAEMAMGASAIRRLAGNQEIGAAHRPAGVPESWVPVPLAGATKQTLLLGLLRRADKPTPMKDLVDAIDKLGIAGAKTVRGSVFNIGPRLEERGIVERRNEGLILVDREKAPIINERYVWGRPDVFQSSELAARRREIILEILGQSPHGLRNVDIAAELRKRPTIGTSVTKEVVKMDMEHLGDTEQKVARLPGSRKWVLAGDPRLKEEPRQIAFDEAGE